MFGVQPEVSISWKRVFVGAAVIAAFSMVLYFSGASTLLFSFIAPDMDASAFVYSFVVAAWSLLIITPVYFIGKALVDWLDSM